MANEQSAEGNRTARLTTYYNGACPVCSAEIGHYRKIDRREGLGLGWVDISEQEEALRARGIDPDTATRRLYAVDESGRLHAGIDAFALVWERLPRYRWLARLTRTPGLKQIIGWAYEYLMAWPIYLWNKRRLARRAAARTPG